MVKVNLSKTVISCKPIDIDNTPLKFGKYKGRTPNEIAKSDPSYISFMWNKFTDPPVTRELALDCDYREQNRDEFEDDEDVDPEDAREQWARGIANDE